MQPLNIQVIVPISSFLLNRKIINLSQYEDDDPSSCMLIKLRSEDSFLTLPLGDYKSFIHHPINGC